MRKGDHMGGLSHKQGGMLAVHQKQVGCVKTCMPGNVDLAISCVCWNSHREKSQLNHFAPGTETC